MTKKYKILGKYIKDMSSETPNIETYIFVRDQIAKYQLGIDITSEALKNGNSVEVRGLGRWYCKKLKENFNARNPLTNENIYKPERFKVRFRSSKKLNKIINE